MKRQFTIYTVLVMLAFNSCHEYFLDERPSKDLVVPETLQDYQAILDNTAVMNNIGHNSVLMDGDFEFLETSLVGQAALTRNSYLWKPDLYETNLSTISWTAPYKQILTANLAIEGLGKIHATSTEQTQYNNILGSAYFYRAFAFHELAVLFTAPYQEATAGSTLGLPLKLTADVTDIVQRATLKATYEQIVEDLQQSINLLPLNQPAISRPTKAAAYAQLARVYLIMGRYDLALANAKEALKLKADLIDYNQVAVSTSRTFAQPFNVPNAEMLFYSRDGYSSNNNANFLLKQDFYDAYPANDLRRTRFFTSGRRFIGTYTGLGQALCGLATDEVYLIAAECEARANRPQQALDYLNDLCIKRYDNTYVPYSSSDAEQVLNWVLAERRKELVTRRRWEDLRRLNLDSRFAVTLTRTYKGDTYTLPPNSSRYVMAFPQEEIDNSGIVQNERKDD